MTNEHGDLRARLRIGTADAHSRLEVALDLLAVPAEKARFVEILEGFRSFHFVWEQALASRLPDDTAWLAERRKLALLDDDLRALGVSNAAIDSLCVAPFAEALCADVPAALGSLYVLEGSTLGGKFISRHLATAAAAWLPAGGLRYFDPYGDATGTRWKATLARLDAARASDHARIVHGAARTFEALTDWLPSRPAFARHLDPAAAA